MNYQPFFNMHLLLSDDLLSVLRATYQTVAWVGLCVLLFLALYWLIKNSLI